MPPWQRAPVYVTLHAMAECEKKHMALVFGGRFPGEKAAAIFAAKNAEAFADQGFDVTFVAPARYDRIRRTPQEEWGIKENFRVRYLPIIDLFSVPFIRKIAFYVALISYTPVVGFYIYIKRRTTAVVYSNEAFPLAAASLFCPTVYELHDFPQTLLFVYQFLFKRVKLIVSTNEWKRDELVRRFGVSPDIILIERNAVDLARFPALSKEEAREKLKLKKDGRYVVYTGQLYVWKGADTLAEAAQKSPEIDFVFVGGVDSDLERFKKRWQHVLNIHMVGQIAQEYVPLWQRAADVLVIPNTGKEEIATHYTSPMKLFEYMAAERPIVASDIPSIKEIVNDSSAYFAKPDDSSDFARVIKMALEDPGALEKAKEARRIVEDHTWEKRAARIKERIGTIGLS